MHVWHIVPQHIILHDKKYFSNLTLAKSNVNIMLGLIDLILVFKRVTIVLPSGTKIYINDDLYYANSNQNLLSFKDIRQNGYHIVTTNNGSNEYVLCLFLGENKFWKNFLLTHVGYIRQVSDTLNHMLS